MRAHDRGRQALLVVGGTIGDRRGRKGMFLLGLALFGAGCLADSLVPSTGWLLAARVLQGLGPVLLVPDSLTIIRALFDTNTAARKPSACGPPVPASGWRPGPWSAGSSPRTWAGAGCSGSTCRW